MDFLTILTRATPILAGLLYVTAAVAWGIKGNWGWGLMWFGYFLGNVGILIAGWND